MPARRHDDATIAAALALYETDGPTAVQERMGISKSTVAGWARANGIRTRAIETKSARVQAQMVAWEERRVALAQRMGAVAEKALTVAEDMLDEGATSKAKDAATTMAILADKAQLLTGGATSRQFQHGVQDAVIADAKQNALRLVS